MIAHYCRQSLSLFVLCAFIFIFIFIPSSAKAEQPPPVSLTFPVATLHQTLNSLLPFPVKPQKKNRHFQGTLVVDSISKLTVKKQNVIALQGQLSGRNMAVNARVGGRSIQIKLGRMTLPVSCDITLHYDRKKKTLFLKPTFSKQDPKQNPAAAALGPLLDGLSKEYPLPLDELRPLTGEPGGTPIFVQLEPVDIRLTGDALVFQFFPHAGKK